MKHFTLDEATAALTDVRPLAEQIVGARRSMRLHEQALAEARQAAAGNGAEVDGARIETATAAVGEAAQVIAGCVETIERLGAQVKDLDLGLVDFPARHPETSETVLLCWRAGEAEISHWHGLEEGFAGRKPLPF